MIAIFKRIPRPVALWLAGMFLGSVGLFVFVNTLITRVFPTFAYQQPFTFADFFLVTPLCAIAFTLIIYGFRLFMSGYYSIKP